VRLLAQLLLLLLLLLANTWSSKGTRKEGV
jgi:hypothetical protein